MDIQQHLVLFSVTVSWLRLRGYQEFNLACLVSFKALPLASHLHKTRFRADKLNHRELAEGIGVRELIRSVSTIHTFDLVCTLDYWLG